MSGSLTGLDLIGGAWNPNVSQDDFQRSQGLLGGMGAAAGLLAAGGPSRMPVGLGQAIGQGLQGYMGGMSQAQAAQMEAQKLAQARMQTMLQQQMVPFQIANFQQMLGQGQGQDQQPQPQAQPDVPQPGGVDTRGMRNNNPLNLKYAGQNGAGNDGTFATYPDSGSGFAAAANQLLKYGQSGVNTVRGIVAKWAPSSENDTDSYVKNVSMMTGFAPDQPLDLQDEATMGKLIGAMGRVENGKPVSVPHLKYGNGAYQVASNGPVAPPQQPQQTQGNQAAAGELANLRRQYQYFSSMAMLDPKYATMAQGVLSRMESIAGKGAVVLPTGQVAVAPGAAGAAYTMAYNTEGGGAAGKVGPETQLAANKANIDLLRSRQTAENVRGVGIVTPGAVTPPARQIMPNGSLGEVLPGQEGQGTSAGSYQPPPGVVVSPLPGGTGLSSNAAAQDAQYTEDRKAADEAFGHAQAAQAAQTKLSEMVHIASSPTFKPGAGGTFRADLANLAQTYLGPNANEWLKRNAMLPDAAKSQEFAKLALANAGQQEQQTLGARGGFRAIELYQKANPNLEMQDTAIRDILNLQRVAQQADVDYSKGLVDWVHEKGQAWTARRANYEPSQGYDKQWLEQKNPQVYAAATDALNGKPINVLAERYGLGKDELKRVAQIVARVDPTAKLVGNDGKTLYPVQSLLGGSNGGR